MLHRRHALVALQVEFSPLQMAAQADGTLQQCVDLGLTAMAWLPLGGGRLFGDDTQVIRVRNVLQTLGAPHGASIATLAFAWVLRHPARSHPINASGRIEALRGAVAALAEPPILADDWYRVWQASMGREVA